MESNNAILFTFGIVFIFLGIFAPIINNEFNTGVPEIETDNLENIGQTDITESNAIQILSGIFFWVFGAPFWINAVITMMRILFWVIVYDKIRGI